MRFVRSAALLLGGSLFLGACGARTDSSEGFPGAGGSTGPSHDCCSPHSGPGCSDAGIQECVCGFDPACCTDRWSPRCALTVTFGECGVCEGDSGSGGRDPATGGRGNTGGYSTGGGQFVGGASAGGSFPAGGQLNTGGVAVGGSIQPTGGQSSGGAGPGAGGSSPNCCRPGPAGLGSCDDPETLACVCQTDPFCCTNYWDEVCTLQALDCGACGLDGSGGSGVGGSGVAGSGGIASGGIDSGGRPGAGGALAGGGGSANAGGSAGNQGVGGAFLSLCESTLGSACGQCLCPTCGSEILGCLGDSGCWRIFACAAEQGCSGVDCYRPDTCRDVIDDFGSSLPKALALLACSSGSGCSCF